MPVSRTDKVALERFDDVMDILLRPIPIRQQISDAVPLRAAVILAALSIIEEFAVMDAHILLILSAVLDFHRFYSPLSLLTSGQLPKARTHPKPKRLSDHFRLVSQR